MLYGWDISTSIVGFSTFTNDCVYVGSEYIDLRKIENGFPDKAYAVHVFIEGLAARIHQDGLDQELHTHYVEDKLGGFAGGRTMQQTLLKLAAFNSVVSYIAWQQFYKSGLKVKFEHIHPSTVKAIMKRDGLLIPKGSDKKQLTLDFVSKREQKFPVTLNKNGNPQPYCFDMADSYIVAVAGHRKYGCNAKES